jgi:hypothetical protein
MKISLLSFGILCLGLLSVISSRQVISHNNAESYVQFAKLAYCQKESVQSQTCNSCQTINSLGHQVIHVESFEKDNVTFQMVISHSTSSEIVIAFGGPKSENIEYFQEIYKKGLIPIGPIGNVAIEPEFWQIYANNFRTVLANHLGTFGLNQKITLVGHSFGGSLAMLAAYDLIFNNVIIKNPVNGPFIYTYGALKIGSQDFIQRLQNLISLPIYRVRNRYDVFTLMPRCIYYGSMSFHCYRSYVGLVRAYPFYAGYYVNYSPTIRTQLTQKIPEVVKTVTKKIVKQSKAINKSTPKIQVQHPIKGSQNLQQTAIKDHRINNILNKNHLTTHPVQRYANSQPLKYNTPSTFTQQRYNSPQPLSYQQRPSYSSYTPRVSYGQSSNSYGGSSSGSYGRRDKRKRPYREKRHSSFLETAFEVSKDKSYLAEFFKTCSTEGNYVSCSYKPELHQVYFGINIEECN